MEELLNGSGSYGATGGGGSPVSQRSSAFRRESNALADISEDDEQAFQQVAAMFPTVDENHIRDLLKK